MTQGSRLFDELGKLSVEITTSAGSGHPSTAKFILELFDAYGMQSA